MTLMTLMDNLKFSGVEQMKVIFDLCDQDQDGLINAQDLRKIGREYLEKPQQVDMLVKVMDPQSTGNISFVMFCRGIETFLLENERVQNIESNSPSQVNAKVTSSEECDSAFSTSDDDIYPMVHHNGSYLSNGYATSNSNSLASAIELVVDHCETLSSDDIILQSTPSPNSPPTIRVSKESPTLVARDLMRKHQLTLPDSPSQTSTPAEEEEVSRLNDQLHELSYRLEELEEDQKGNEGYKTRIKKENTQLIARLEECEDMLRNSELSNKQMLSASQENLRTSMNKVYRESDRQLMELKSQLHHMSVKLMKAENIRESLKMKIELAQEEISSKEMDIDDYKERHKLVEEELRKTREQLRSERESWELEKESLIQVVQERDVQVEHLLLEHEKVHSDQRRNSVTAFCMEREVKMLKKQLEESNHRNEAFHSRFLQEGKKLVTTSNSPQSLEMEIESVSKDEMMTALRTSEEDKARLKHYLDGLLTTIIEQHPELLERV